MHNFLCFSLFTVFFVSFVNLIITPFRKCASMAHGDWEQTTVALCTLYPGPHVHARCVWRIARALAVPAPGLAARGQHTIDLSRAGPPRRLPAPLPSPAAASL